MTMSPPRVRIDDDRIDTAPRLATSPRPALRLSVNSAPSLRSVDRSIEMSRSAFKVRLTARVGVALISALTTWMSPWPWPSWRVVTVTLVLPFSADSMLAVLSTAVPPVPMKLGPALTWLLGAPLVMIRSSGSSSHWPARPAGESVRSDTGCASSQPPEVSMKPPSPPNGPPRALSVP